MQLHQGAQRIDAVQISFLVLAAVLNSGQHVRHGLMVARSKVAFRLCAVRGCVSKHPELRVSWNFDLLHVEHAIFYSKGVFHSYAS